MPEIKIQRDTKVILSMSEEEAQHLNGLLCAANSGCNSVLRELENSLADAMSDSTVPLPSFSYNGGYFELDAFSP